VLLEVKYFDFEIILFFWRCAMFDLGVLALRLALGAVFLGHGAQKAFGAFGGPGFEGAAGFIGSMGFRPARFWAALAVGGELVAGVLFLLGILTPLAGLLVLATMAVAMPQELGDRAAHRITHGDEPVDHLYDGVRHLEIAVERHDVRATHGAGCTHSAALAAELAKGRSLEEAARTAAHVASSAVRRGLVELGAGDGPVDVLGLSA